MTQLINLMLLSQTKGRYLRAEKALVAHEAIFEESPIVCSQYLWNKEYKYAACEHCLTPLETAEEAARRLTGDQTITLPYMFECCVTDPTKHVPCHSGCDARYCSAECREEAWRVYHRSMCAGVPENATRAALLAQLSEVWRSTHYPPETCSILLVVKLLFSIKHSPSPAEAIEEFNQFCSRLSEPQEHQQEQLHKLLGEKFRENIGICQQLVGEITADPFLSRILNAERGFLTLLALVARNGQGIGTNAFSKWAENVERLVANNAGELATINTMIDQLYQRMDEVTGLTFLNNEGSGLYRLQSGVNHSCEPNAQVTFPNNNNRLVLQALRNIEPGEEITICYLDECMQSRSRHTRRKYLLENYLFTCTCTKCEAQAADPDVTSDEEEDDDDDGGDEDEDMASD